MGQAAAEIGEKREREGGEECRCPGCHSHGYEGRFGHGLGHSVGIDIHEEPRLSMTCSAILEENQIMTVEPGIYLPGVGGVRIEDSVIVKKDGCIPLTSPTRELIIL